MISYSDLYEVLRKEKYSEVLQPLAGKFLEEFREYVVDARKNTSASGDLFSDSVAKSRKQLENAVSIFKELMLKRKRKILNLVFVATETGIMKRDYENMLLLEKGVFDSLVKCFESGDKELQKVLNGRESEEVVEAKSRMVIFTQDVEEFVDHTGNLVGPFKEKSLANLDSGVAGILVSGGKAGFVDEV